MTVPETIGPPDPAYIPGKNRRHPDHLFEPALSEAQGLNFAAIPKSVLWRSALNFMHSGYYWEAHELLEPLWLICPPNSPERFAIRALIQTANAALKVRMDRPEAGRKLRESAIRDMKEATLRGRGMLWGDTEMVQRLGIIMHNSGTKVQKTPFTSASK